jgi:anti-sigma factor (TIGR02949 family)
MRERDPRCAAYLEDLSAFLDGELPPGRAAELRAHLEVCPGCAARLSRLREVDARLVASARRVAVPGDLRARLAARIAADAAAPRRGAPRRAPAWRGPRLARRAAAFAAAAAAAALALVLARPGGETELGGSDEDLALLLELETVEDLDVIANLDLLERMVELGEGTG